MPVLIIFTFLVLFGAIMLAVTVGARYLEQRRRRSVAGRLAGHDRAAFEPDFAPVVRDSPRDAAVSAFLLARSRRARTMNAYLQQAALDWSFGRLLAWTLAGAVAGALLAVWARVLFSYVFSAAALGVVSGALPCLYVLRRRRQRLAAFEAQFPEALNFLARSLRAGHALTLSLGMLAEESPQPLRSEFQKVFQEQNLGESVAVALRRLAERVPLLDVRFFVAAVLVQRETGGNLGEILTKLAGVIRERFRLRGQVRAASAHGRITAMILTFLPLVTVLALALVAPSYPQALAEDPDGRYLILAAIVGQVTGYFLMRNIINIKV